MIRIRDLPSIVQFVDELENAFERRELVILGCPPRSMWQPWTQAILDALEEVSRKRDVVHPVVLPDLDGNSDIPYVEWGAALGQAEHHSAEELLEAVGPETITVIKIKCSAGLSDAWRRLFARIGKIYRTNTQSYGPVLAVLVDCEQFPPISPGVGIRVRALWNTIRWEEVRLMVDSMIPTNENALVRAWRIAVYSGACSSDPDVAAMLCRHIPNSLTETTNLVLDANGKRPTVSATISNVVAADQRWEVPSAVVADWAKGSVGGFTLERGTMLNISLLTEKDAKTYIRTNIWREQVAGLLAVVMEMGFSVARDVTSVVGERWLGDSADDLRLPDGRINLEPAEVLEKLRTPPRTHVPDVLWQTLLLLRNTRNDLAHMRAVDYGRIRELWRRYDQVRVYFGASTARRV